MCLGKSYEFQALTANIGKSIRRLQRRSNYEEISNHLRILRNHGKDISASQTMINFCIELAEPVATGGVVVLLERPPPAEETRCGGGYESVTSKIETFRRLSRLVGLATNNVLGLEDITVLDAFPLWPIDDADDRADACEKRCSGLLVEILAAKRPDMVISCFSAGGHQGVLVGCCLICCSGDIMMGLRNG